jgi:outer membrane receptor protein involved in Fe transport
LFGGLELSKRDVETPIVSAVIPGQVDEVDIKERLGRAYLFWTPIRWISASVEYQVERFDSSDPTQPFAPKVKTHRVPIGLNVYHEQGFFGKLKTTYVDQDGSFLNAASGIFEEGEDHFWVLDASIGYRLPKRLGIITVDAKNLLDEDFNFQDTDPAIPLIQPETLIFTKLTLAF